MSKLSPVSYKKLVAVFEAEGFVCVRTEGDHMIFTKPGIVRPVVIPKYASLPVFIIKNNLKTGGISETVILNSWVNSAPQFLSL